MKLLPIFDFWIFLSRKPDYRGGGNIAKSFSPKNSDILANSAILGRRYWVARIYGVICNTLTYEAMGNTFGNNPLYFVWQIHRRKNYLHVRFLVRRFQTGLNIRINTIFRILVISNFDNNWYIKKPLGSCVGRYKGYFDKFSVKIQKLSRGNIKILIISFWQFSDLREKFSKYLLFKDYFI